MLEMSWRENRIQNCMNSRVLSSGEVENLAENQRSVNLRVTRRQFRQRERGSDRRLPQPWRTTASPDAATSLRWSSAITVSPRTKTLLRRLPRKSARCCTEKDRTACTVAKW